MSDVFDRLAGSLVGREGGYVDHPSDRGGPTIWGVTQETARRYGYRGDMRTMPRAVALDIYRARYFTGPGFDQVATVSERIAEELLDTGVNMGPSVAAEFLQHALNGLNRQGRDYADIAVDGDVGPATMRALRAYLAKRGAEGEGVLLKALDAQQGARYIQIAQGRPKNEDFLYGWLRTRVGALA